MAWSLVGRATVEVPLLEFLDVCDLFGAGLGRRQERLKEEV